MGPTPCRPLRLGACPEHDEWVSPWGIARLSHLVGADPVSAHPAPKGPRHPERMQGLAAASRPTGSAGGSNAKRLGMHALLALLQRASQCGSTCADVKHTNPGTGRLAAATHAWTRTPAPQCRPMSAAPARPAPKGPRHPER